MKKITQKISIKTTSLPHLRRVMIIYTGGTFGMLQNKKGELVPFDFNYILDHLPILKKLSLNLSVVSFLHPLDSSNIEPADWQVIGDIIFRHYDDQDGFVVLHGTDTMAYTASALSFMLHNLSKPVIFTGAQLPINYPRSDGRENLVNALEIAATYRHGRPIVPEVCICFDHELYRGCRAKKTQSTYFSAFESGNYPLLAKMGIKIEYAQNAIRPFPNERLEFLSRFDPRIAILKLFPGINAEYVQSVVGISGLRGLLLETYGSGNAFNTTWLKERLRQAIEKNILVINISQCTMGSVVQGKYKTSQWLKDIGVISGWDMTIEAATAKMMLLLGEYGFEGAKKQINIDLAGEITIP